MQLLQTGFSSPHLIRRFLHATSTISKTQDLHRQFDILRQPVLVLFLVDRVAARPEPDVAAWLYPSDRPSWESGGLADILMMTCLITVSKIRRRPSATMSVTITSAADKRLVPFRRVRGVERVERSQKSSPDIANSPKMC